MLRRSAPVPTPAGRRIGFTLIELLVVIAIIAVLMGLLLAASMRVLGVGPRAQTTSTLTALAQSINTFAAERQVPYIPAGSYDTTRNQWIGPFRLRNSYPANPANGEPGLTSFEAQYLVRAFNLRLERNTTTGTDELVNLGAPGLRADLDANQTLLFFLNGIQDNDGNGNVAFRGFSKNPQRPFAAPAAVGENRLGPYFGEITARQYVTRPGEFARIIDGWRTPIAYFTAYNAKAQPVPSTTYGGVNTAPGLNGPYFTGTGYANPAGFQLISAGENKRFGAGGNWSSVVGDGGDDRANFSPNNLSSGPQ